jgi:hypothetical protein
MVTSHEANAILKRIVKYFLVDCLVSLILVLKHFVFVTKLWKLCCKLGVEMPVMALCVH